MISSAKSFLSPDSFLSHFSLPSGGHIYLQCRTEFKDAQASLNIKGAGKLITPLGATLIHVPSMDAKKIIALDKNCALEMVQAGDVLTDYDKLIDRQMERAAVSAVAGFAQIYGGAAQGLSY